MAVSLESVSKLLARFSKILERADLTDQSRAHYTSVVEAFNDATAYVSFLQERISDLEAKLKPLPTRLGDLSDLPSELVAELSVPRTDELENQILVVIQAYGGTADLDQILVGLYRRFKVIQKRRFLQNKVWRICQKDMLWSIRGKKGVYTLKEPADDEKDEVPRVSIEEEFEDI
jgi:hypothetical protein